MYFLYLHFEFYISKYISILKCKKCLIGFLDEFINFKQKNFPFQNAFFFFILQQRTPCKNKVFLQRSSLVGWTKMHEVFKSLLPRYFLKDIYVKWSQFEFQTIWSNFHYSQRRLKFLLTIIVLAKFRLKMIFEFFLIKVSQKL